jgi:biopolymer transport protein ExbB/TolQ
MRIRVGLQLTAIIGLLYAAFGLFESLTKFALGLIVACLAVIAYGLIDTLESESDRRLSESREKVWQRRDAQ